MTTLRTASTVFTALILFLVTACGGGDGGNEAQSGTTALCADGWITHSAGSQGACSSHGGLASTTPPVGTVPTAPPPSVPRIAYRSFKKPIVSGLAYLNNNLASPVGLTDETGQFPVMDSALQANVITFSIGGIVVYKLSELNAMSFTLANIYQLKFFLNSGITNDIAVQNLMAFLMAIDDDGDVANGIQINDGVRQAAVSMTVDFNQSSSSFYEDSRVQYVVAVLTSNTAKGARVLPSVTQAIAALK